MADAIFNHSFLDFDSIKRNVGNSVKEFLIEQIFDEFNGMLLRHSSVEDPDNPGGFIPSQNFLVSLARSISTQANNEVVNVKDLSTALLIDGLKFLPNSFILQNGINENQGSNFTTEVLNELMRRSNESETQARFIRDSFKEKRRIDSNFRSDSSTGIAAAPEASTCGLALTIRGNSDARKRLTSAARKNVRSCLRSPQDGKRVSREAHEYRYTVQESNQWQEMLDILRFGNGNVPLTASPNATDYTYGNFVDAVEARKFIGRMRKVRRLAFSANVKRVLAAVGGGTQEDFAMNLLSFLGPEFYNPIIQELNRIKSSESVQASD